MEALKQENNTRFYEFGPFLADTEQSVLLRDGQVVPLGMKAFELLLFLLRQRGQVVKKDELLRQVWPDTVVEENNLVRHISALRKALDEHHNESQYILTIPGRGYRFVADVREWDSEENAAPKPGQSNGIDASAQVDQSETATEAQESPSRQANRSRRNWLRTPTAIGAVIAATALAVFILWRVWRPDSVIDHGAQPKLWQLTFDPGLDSEPTWSPDGNLIAYSSDRGGNFDIWVRPVGEGNPVCVTTSPAHDWQPDWARAGNRLVFRSERDGGGLYVVPVLGGNERKVTGFGYHPRWSPDGRQILFYSSPLHYNTVEIPKVFVVGLDGDAPREVLSPFLAEFNSLQVAWHPDGRRLSVWGEHRQQGWSFWTVTLAGGVGVRSELTAQVRERLREADVALTDFQWSPSGRTLYFEGVSQSVRNVWKVEIEPQSLRWTAGPERLTTGAGQEVNLAVSPDGKKLAVAVLAANTRLWSLPFDATAGKVNGRGQPITEADVNATFPDLSLMGERLVFRAQRAGKEELREKSLKDGRETVLVSDDFSRRRIRWSRDGLRLAYMRLRPLNPERTRIERSFVMLLAGSSDERTLASSDTTTDAPYDWSADGKWVMASTDRQSPGRRGIGLFPIAAAPHAETQLRVLTSHPEQNLWQARFSPDDSWVSFIAAKAVEAGISTIHVIPAAGGPWKQITEGKYFDDKPRWSPDGRKIYFVSNRTGFFNVWGIGFDPASGEAIGQPFRVTAFESPRQMIPTDVRVMEMALSANRLILPIMEVSGRIWILENL
ncbi:MAG TPA: winged helix-turn-helix domain-containing protein [Blastocatellia bacterium]|nr:winged helix-turn-helix domain-containing protein [Blastocatellia bacterium]